MTDISNLPAVISPVGGIMADALTRNAEQTTEQMMQLVAELHVGQERLAQRGAQLAQMIRNSVSDFVAEVQTHATKHQRIADLFDTELDKLKSEADEPQQ